MARRIVVKFYKSELGALARLDGDSLNPIPWRPHSFTFSFPWGLFFFALRRVDAQNMLLSSPFWGFIYGVTLHGVYDMTNYSLPDKYFPCAWPLWISHGEACFARLSLAWQQ